MIIRNLLTAEASIKQRVRRLILYLSRKNGAKKAWNDRHSSVFFKHPEYKNPVTGGTEEKHRNIWRLFWGKVPVETLRICHAISGSSSPDFIPEEIFQTDIEPSLNRVPDAHYLANKSFYNRWFPQGVFPCDYLHNISGQMLNSRYEHLAADALDCAADELPYPVVLKPNLDSYGGSGIQFIESKEQLLSEIVGRHNFVVQEKIRQHKEQNQLHPQSLNTVRIYLYRSVEDNRVHIINIAQRMGNGSVLDNVASGGLVSYVGEDGSMHGYALDRYGQKYLKHPVTDISFDNALPEFESMKKLAKEIASKLFYLRIVGLDLCFDQDGNWRVIEVNTKGHSIRFAQYAGHPFFGEFTDEVISYCKEHHWAFSA